MTLRHDPLREAMPALRTAVLDAAFDAIIAVDDRGHVLDVNAAALEIFGFTREAMVGHELAVLIIPPHLRDAHRRGLARHVAERGPVRAGRAEMTALHADGHEFPVELSITRPDVDGPPVFYGYLRDITEQREADAARQALVEELAASRARIVEAADDERRRLERNLHDGAQQRFVSLAMTLALIDAQLPADGRAHLQLEAARADLADALAELREFARGIHPTVLTERGLGIALDSLARRAPLPTEVTVALDRALPPAVEAALYYVCAEGLTNAARYAQASVVTIEVTAHDDRVTVVVTDDGVGGADGRAGSGLLGLTDRVGAQGGDLELDSPVGAGTTLRAWLPL